jgi:hypothetical protein
MKRLVATLKEADIRHIISVITSIGSYLVLYLLIVKAIPTANHDIVIAGVSYVLGQANGSVYGYLFNATKTDKKKPQEEKPD